MNTNPETDARYNTAVNDLRTNTSAQREPALKEKRGANPDSQAATIPRRSGSEPTAASYAQRRLWFLDQLDPGSAAYNLAYNLRLAGELNVESLRLAFEMIAQRHEVLRTTFEAREGEPLQRIHAPVRWSLPLTDLSALPEPVRDIEFRRLAEVEARRAFDLGQGPLLRTTLVKLDEFEHVLLGTIHHIISDGWSMRVLMSELATNYRALRQGWPSALPELPVQYADYAAWQQQWLTDEALESQLSYWTNILAGAPPALDLPTDRRRSAALSHPGAEVAVEVPAAVGERLRTMARREGATLFMVLLAAFQALLCRLSGKQVIVVGTPITGRSRRELEGLIGFFVNTLALVADLRDNPSFAELLAQVKETTLGAYAHQDTPFEKLVEKLSPRRDLARTPLFQVMLTAQKATSGSVQLEELTTTPFETHTGMAKFDLTLKLLYEDGGRIRGSLEYATDLFDRATVERLIGHFNTLLRAAADNPQTRISELQILTAAEQQLLDEWGSTGKTYADSLLVHELFETQAAKSPDKVTAFYNGRYWTFQEINEQADRLADLLRGLRDD